MADSTGIDRALTRDARPGASGAETQGQFSHAVALLERPMALEQKMGWQNAAAFGGLDRYVGKWALEARNAAPDADAAREMDELSALFADYGVLTPEIRKARVVRACQLLAGLRDAPRGRGAASGSRLPGEPEARPARELPNSEPCGSGDEEQPPCKDRAEAEKPSNRDLAKPVTHLRGVGSMTARHLERLGLRTVEDALWHLPRRHEDRRRVAKIGQLRDGDMVAITGQVTTVAVINPKPNLAIFKATLSDGTGHLQLVFFNRPYLRSAIRKGMRMLVCGKVERSRFGVQMKSPEFEEMAAEDERIHVGRIVPIYGLTESLTQRALRKIMKLAIDDFAGAVPEVLPSSVRRAQGLMGRVEALRQAHFPDTPELREQALERLIFEELFVLQVGMALRRKETERVPRGQRYALSADSFGEFARSLPFTLTQAQRRVLREIGDDLLSPVPMSRLVQGDVGSGKTVVAAFAAWAACVSGSQAAVMAPTEILAEQLARKLQDLIGHQYSVRLLTGAMSAREKDGLTTGLALGEIDVAVGTHALIQDGVRFARLSMAIIDEQHKFGVVQRSMLRNKGYNPDVLVMTATPIPRTLALTVYGDLESSVIDELPPGRSPIRSVWRRPAQLDSIYQGVERQLAEGRQAFIVCPLIDESEKMEAASAVAEAQMVAERFPHRRVGLLHGRMKSDEKDAVMSRFRAHEFDILVSTTVVEVGVDVPNATVMVVQNADRFGLAQLHQLRGRVGRGAHQSYCAYVADPQTEEGVERMRVIESTVDGFQIAEADLKFRGPGEFYGSRQSGLPDLKVADLVRDRKVLERAREAARELVTRDGYLGALECVSLKDEVLRCFRGQLVSLLS